jgi:hypothetical protein
METNERNLKKLFQGDTRYVVPLFQRPYVWNRQDQWEPLWEDIRDLADAEMRGQASPHFMGAIVLNQLRQPTGELDVRLIIDGQQRLTTIQLFLEAMRDIAESEHHKKLEALERLTRNPLDVCSIPEEQYKVWPTNADRSAFMQVMLAKHPRELKASNAGSIADAWSYFFVQISEWLLEEPEQKADRLEALNSAVTQRLSFVVIDLEEGEDPQVIFETLNARMTPLLPADLIKNVLFRNVGQSDGEAAAEALYRETWQSFETDHGFWRIETGRGHARRYRIDLFLQNYLTAVTADEVPVAHLYSYFLTRLQRRRLTSRQWLEEIARYSESFRTIVDCSGRHSERLSALAQLNYDTLNPFILQMLVRRADDAAGVERALKYVESFLVRRLVCGLTTRGYGRFFLSLLPAIDSDDFATATHEKLRQSAADASRWPDDEEFRRAWLSTPVYHFQKGRLIAILLSVERALAGKFGEKVAIESDLTIEHILPQQWEANYPLPSEAAPEHRMRRDSLLHTFRNLTLVSGALNGSMSNAPWADDQSGRRGKRSALMEHSQLNMNRRLLDDPRWQTAWNDEAIELRGTVLFEAARKVWPIFRT